MKGFNEERKELAASQKAIAQDGETAFVYTEVAGGGLLQVVGHHRRRGGVRARLRCVR